MQNILNNNTKKIEIDKLIKIFKNAMIAIIEKNYDIFTREQAQKIYHHLLEEYFLKSFPISISLVDSKIYIDLKPFEFVDYFLNFLQIHISSFLNISITSLNKSIAEFFKKFCSGISLRLFLIFCIDSFLYCSSFFIAS